MGERVNLREAVERVADAIHDGGKTLSFACGDSGTIRYDVISPQDKGLQIECGDSGESEYLPWWQVRVILLSLTGVAEEYVKDKCPTCGQHICPACGR